MHGWVAWLRRLLPVYEALEAAEQRWQDDPRAGAVVDPLLHRSAAVRADLVHLAGDGSDGGADDGASAAYVARLRALGTAPAFLAHHCTRYLGDLSGGQVVRRALQRSLGLDDGVTCLRFPGDDLKGRYRQRLDAVVLSAAEREELVAESLVAYRLTVDLTEGLPAGRSLAR